jgi:flagellar biosynthesis component FlhA
VATRGLLDAIGHGLERRAAVSGRPALLVAQELRPHLRRLIEHALPSVGVLSFGEIPSAVKITSSIPVEASVNAN